MKYEVTITSITTYVVDVEALSGDEAEEQAMRKLAHLLDIGKHEAKDVARVERDNIVTNVLNEEGVSVI